jgi:hypothetical protein
MQPFHVHQGGRVLKRPTLLLIYVLPVLLGLSGVIQAQTIPLNKDIHSNRVAESVAFRPQRSILNINNLWLKLQNDGLIGYDSLKGGGLTYPMQYGGLLYCDNLIWVGKVKDGRLPEVRTGGGLYRAGTVPGAILNKGVPENPESPAVRVYRVRPDYKEADLTLDAAGYFDAAVTKVTPEKVAAVREQYERDWKEWPWEKGAPFVDKNGNGAMNPDESPGLLNADQVAWFAFNDLDETVCKSFYGGPPIGIEVQLTLWAYKGIPEFENVIFKRYRLIYKGTASTPVNAIIDSLYLSQFVDPDVGYFADDLAGCDSVLSLGFGYSATSPDILYKPLGWQSPGIGYAILQGPLIPGNQGDEGVFNFEFRKEMKNMPMTSFLLNSTGDAISEPTYGAPTCWFWNQARGFFPYYGGPISSWPFVNPTGELTKYMAAGDPVAGTGWIDGVYKDWGGLNAYGFSTSPGERTFFMNAGPLTMALGDTQEVVIAIIACMASDGRQSTAVLKYNTKLLRTIYPYLAEKAAGREPAAPVAPAAPRDFLLERNYPNPFNPATHIRYAIPVDATVRLSVFDVLGREIKVLVDATQPAGWYALEWNGTDDKNNLVPSGVYFYRLIVKDVELTKKMMIVR